MSSSRSGSKQEFAIADVGTTMFTVISGIDTGFTGFTLTPSDNSYTNTSGGLTTSKKSGHVTRAGTFGVGENAASIPVLLGRNGRRALIRNRPQGAGAGLPQQQFEAILVIARNFSGRGKRAFQVNVSVDGPVTTTTQ